MTESVLSCERVVIFASYNLKHFVTSCISKPDLLTKPIVLLSKPVGPVLQNYAYCSNIATIPDMEEKKIKIGILREGKIPPDERAPFGPVECKKLEEKYPCEVLVQNSEVRRIRAEAYEEQGIQLVDSLEDADVLFGVKEVPINELIDGKTYFFFSHTIKKQPHNAKLLRAVLDKNIRLIDYERLTNNQGFRVLGFGHFAGLVGTYNGFRMIGMKTGKYDLKLAHSCEHLEDLLTELKKVKIDPLKICITGTGRVAGGVLEILNNLRIREVSVEDYLSKQFDQSVYVQLEVDDYNKRTDGSKGSVSEFFKHPELYQSNFKRFLPVTDYYIAAHFWDSKAPVFFAPEDMKEDDFGIKYISDISCDLGGPIPTTLRSSTIADPFYGVDKKTLQERPFADKEAVAVMAVDNLPCELPVDASIDFGKQLMKHVVPHLFNNDAEEVLKRATIAEGGKLTEPYLYLEDYARG